MAQKQTRASVRFNLSAVAAVWPCWCCGADDRAHATKNTAQREQEQNCAYCAGRARSPLPAVRKRFDKLVWMCLLLALFTPFEGNPAARWTDTGFFFSCTKWQPCCRQPGGPAAACVRGGTRSLRCLLVPALHTGSSPGCWFGLTSCLVLVTGEQPCGLKAKGVAIETRRFPHSSCGTPDAVSPVFPAFTHAHPGAPPSPRLIMFFSLK